MDALLARLRLLALRRFSASAEPLAAFFDEADRLSVAAWPNLPGETSPAPDEAPVQAEEPNDADDEANASDADDALEIVPQDPGEALAALMAHLDQLEELMEALNKQ